jgi:hypothetical protein
MFRATRPSSGANRISFTNAAYGALVAARCLEERARQWCVAQSLESLLHLWNTKLIYLE